MYKDQNFIIVETSSEKIYADISSPSFIKDKIIFNKEEYMVVSDDQMLKD